MSVKEKLSGDVTVLTFKGKLMGGQETNELRDRMHNLIDSGVRKVVLDLGKVKWMNSTGIGALNDCLLSMRKSGGDLKLARLTNKVQSLLIVTQLIKIFENFESVEEAVSNFEEVLV